MAKAFALVLRKHRQAKGMTQERLAELAELHHTHIGLIERDCRKPSLDVAKAIANGLGMSLAEMIAEAERIQKKQH